MDAERKSKAGIELGAEYDYGWLHFSVDSKDELTGLVYAADDAHLGSLTPSGGPKSGPYAEPILHAIITSAVLLRQITCSHAY